MSQQQVTAGILGPMMMSVISMLPTFLFSRFLTFFSTMAMAAWMEVS